MKDRCMFSSLNDLNEIRCRVNKYMSNQGFMVKLKKTSCSFRSKKNHAFFCCLTCLINVD